MSCNSFNQHPPSNRCVSVRAGVGARNTSFGSRVCYHEVKRLRTKSHWPCSCMVVPSSRIQQRPQTSFELCGVPQCARNQEFEANNTTNGKFKEVQSFGQALIDVLIGDSDIRRSRCPHGSNRYLWRWTHEKCRSAQRKRVVPILIGAQLVNVHPYSKIGSQSSSDLSDLNSNHDAHAPAGRNTPRLPSEKQSKKKKKKNTEFSFRILPTPHR